jgi:hypothetical protein
MLKTLVGIAVLLALGACTAVQTCAPEDVECRLTRLEHQQRMDQHSRMARQNCEFAHGPGSILCRGL